MAKYIIQGAIKLNGTISISGNKNATFPCIAASLLTDEEVTLENVPKISDVLVMVEILRSLGVEAVFTNHSLKIKATRLSTSKIPEELGRKLRGSVVLTGALLSRMGKVEFAHPGGDIIGKRSIQPHIEALSEVGYKFKIKDTNYFGSKGLLPFKNQLIFLDEASVTGAENLILAIVLNNGVKVTIKNCPEEPHILDLCNMLCKMGAKIEGMGSSTLIITGVKKLNGVSFGLGPDFIELGTYAVAAAITQGNISIKNCSLEGLDPVIYPLEKMGVQFEQKSDRVIISAKKLVAIPRLHTNIWPGFPSDLMSSAILLATQAKGISLLHDWMYESRMFFVDKLISMGANITIADPHRVLVYGPTKFIGRDLDSPDIRAGMAILLAALIAKGQTTINHAELIERGYEDVVEKLNSLGASIIRTK